MVRKIDAVSDTQQGSENHHRTHSTYESVNSGGGGGGSWKDFSQNLNSDDLRRWCGRCDKIDLSSKERAKKGEGKVREREGKLSVFP